MAVIEKEQRRGFIPDTKLHTAVFLETPMWMPRAPFGRSREQASRTPGAKLRSKELDSDRMPKKFGKLCEFTRERVVVLGVPSTPEADDGEWVWIGDEAAYAALFEAD